LKKSLAYYPAIFLGAFLLFMVQPIIGKYLLPWFGGAPSVWTTCLLFFQILLLAGYAYAHFLQRLEFRTQASIHLLLLGAAVAGGGVLFFVWGSPILPAASLKPHGDDAPAWAIFRLLLTGIGLSYFLLSTSASLLQAWFHRMEPSKSAYFFYVVSNAASLLALLSYPFLIEPVLPLKTQALTWSGGFAAYAAICTYCALQLRRAAPPQPRTPAEPDTAGEATPRLRDALHWTVLAACGVLMLMSATNQMTLDVPPVPFLWVLPLALYLLSYIIGFIDRLKNLQNLYILMLGLAGIAAWYLIVEDIEFEMPVQIAGHCFILFTVCLFCHNALFRSRPHPSQLTAFYLCISLGGALGGIFVAVIAPRIFSSYWEYQISLVLAVVLAVVSLHRNPGGLLHKARWIGWMLVVVLAVAITYGPFDEGRSALYRGRNFFGSLRVDQSEQPEGKLNTLYHGRIGHGGQFTDAALSKIITTYYTAESGVGLAIQALEDRMPDSPLRMGVVGLGAGTLAAYGRPGDAYRLYEINPQVIALARNPEIFTFLQDSDAAIETVLGDGRIQLERELRERGSNQFNLLVLDAFSGDAPPAHLLTKEAFALYLEHLAPDGLIAVNISNRYINFMPLMRAVKNEFSLYGVLIYNEATALNYTEASDWIIFSPSTENMTAELWYNDTFEDYPGTVRIWTDDYSNLLTLFW
jgi:hypothetical protein